MSRRKARLAQNAASLKDSAAFKALVFCEAQVNGLRCGAYAKRCYDLEQNHVTDLCSRHRQEAGYCVDCGNQLTKAEKKLKTPKCAACETKRQRAYEREDIYDDDYYG